jgi:hypothetical protein
LVFVSVSGTDAAFVLGNGTSRSIGVTSPQALLSGFDFWITCNDMLLNNLPADHGQSERETLTPGETTRVSISGEFQKGGRCSVRLKLRDGTEVDSNEFKT